MKRTLKKGLLFGTETVLSVVAVLVFFVVFLGILGLSFPTGTSLGELIGSDGVAQSAPGKAGRSGVELAVEDRGADAIVALLTRVRNTVKDKPPQAIAWGTSRTGATLGDRHAVQTFNSSGATVSFGPDQELHLEENSLIVLKRMARFRLSGKRRTSLIVLDGELRGNIDVKGNETTALEVVTATESARMTAEAGPGDATNFAVKVNTDGSSTFSIYEGSAEIQSGDETVTMGPEQTLTVVAEEPLGRPAALPGTPDPVAPADSSERYYRLVPPRVEFRWNASLESNASRILIARDAEFKDVVHEEQVDGEKFVHGNLEAGDYYWRVSHRRDSVEGTPSVTRSLRIVQDREAPALSVSFPTEPVDSKEVVVRGVTDPDAVVFIRDAKVTVLETGQFEYVLALERGLNVVVVEAIDPAGNVAYTSEMVNARF